jgi:deoxycytidylate deaminase
MLLQSKLIEVAPNAVKLIKPHKNILIAFKLAETATYQNYKLGAIITTKPKGRILSMGVNSVKSSPTQDKYSPLYSIGSSFIKSKSTHAEIQAIRRACLVSMLGSSIFVARITNKGNWGNSRPCEGCQKAIRDAGISNMFYFIDGDFYAEKIV